MKRLRYILLVFLLPAADAFAVAREGPPLDYVAIDLDDQSVLQRGAKYFVNYCIGCHSAQYMRYATLQSALGLTEQQIEENLVFGEADINDALTTAMSPEYAQQAFGVVPPDLTNIVNIRGTDWVYTFLQSFYRDPSRPFGVNNLVFPDVAMPHVLWQLQGWQEPVYETVIGEDGKPHKLITGLKLVEPGELTPEQYDDMVRDLVVFLAYVAQPYRPLSERIGVWVLPGLLLFTVLAYLLKREYWRDVH